MEVASPACLGNDCVSSVFFHRWLLSTVASGQSSMWAKSKAAVPPEGRFWNPCNTTFGIFYGSTEDQTPGMRGNVLQLLTVGGLAFHLLQLQTPLLDDGSTDTLVGSHVLLGLRSGGGPHGHTATWKLTLGSRACTPKRDIHHCWVKTVSKQGLPGVQTQHQNYSLVTKEIPKPLVVAENS